MWQLIVIAPRHRLMPIKSRYLKTVRGKLLWFCNAHRTFHLGHVLSLGKGWGLMSIKRMPRVDKSCVATFRIAILRCCCFTGADMTQNRIDRISTEAGTRGLTKSKGFNIHAFEL